MKAPYEEEVGSKYGAPMGRTSTPNLTGKAHLRRVPFYDGDYDKGGAYWGGGRFVEPLWCLWTDEGAAYFRAPNREAAKRKAREDGHDVRFYN